MKYDHAKPLIEELMHIAVLFHASGMLRNKIFDALKEFVPDMDDGCFERGCPAINHFSSHTTITQDKSSTKVGTNSGVLPKKWVGLTDEEVADYWVEAFNENGLYVQTFASLIEAKLKEKNT